MKNRLEFIASGFGSLCCIVPVVLGLIGLGGTMWPMFFVSYKIPFLTVAVLALGSAWFLYLRDRKRCLLEGCPLVGAKTRLWLLRGNTFAVVFFMLISLTPLGVLAGNVLFPPPDIEALAAQASSSAGKPVFEKREKLPFAAIGSGAGISVRRSGPAGGEISPGSAATPKAGMARMEKLSLRVEGMS